VTQINNNYAAANGEIIINEETIMTGRRESESGSELQVHYREGSGWRVRRSRNSPRAAWRVACILSQQASVNTPMSHFKEYKFFRSFSSRVEGWSLGKAEKLWRRLREKKIAGTLFLHVNLQFYIFTTCAPSVLCRCFCFGRSLFARLETRSANREGRFRPRCRFMSSC